MAEPYGVNVGRWEADHPGWRLEGDGGRYGARRRDGQGRISGPVVTAATLDELAAKLSTGGDNAA